MEGWHSHINVPGPDGKFGFGGSCFPKDVQAMIEFFKENNEKQILSKVFGKQI